MKHFENIIGYEHIKYELEKIIDCINNKDKYLTLNNESSILEYFIFSKYNGAWDIFVLFINIIGNKISNTKIVLATALLNL